MQQHKKMWKKQDNRDVDFFLSQWFLALALISVILGADAFAEWGAKAIETFFIWIGVL